MAVANLRYINALNNNNNNMYNGARLAKNAATAPDGVRRAANKCGFSRRLNVCSGSVAGRLFHAAGPL